MGPNMSPSIYIDNIKEDIINHINIIRELENKNITKKSKKNNLNDIKLKSLESEINLPTYDIIENILKEIENYD